VSTSIVRVSGIFADPIDSAQFVAAVDDARAGGRVAFCGVVRAEDHGRSVVELEYQSHPSAATRLAEILERYAAEPAVIAVAAGHRVGRLVVGDVALVAAVSTAHRKEAFELCAALVEDIKHELPIWKRQVFADGSDEWVNCP
jgi:molybdopterin synthase catalytic subunit